jgi:hypothetical protein
MEPIYQGSEQYAEYRRQVFSGRVDIGATGAPTVKAPYVTFTRTGVGAYTIRLPKKFRKLITCTLQLRQAASVLYPFIRTDNVVGTGQTEGQITFVIGTNAGVATEMTNGDSIHFEIVVTDHPGNQT